MVIAPAAFCGFNINPPLHSSLQQCHTNCDCCCHIGKATYCWPCSPLRNLSTPPFPTFPHSQPPSFSRCPLDQCRNSSARAAYCAGRKMSRDSRPAALSAPLTTVTTTIPRPAGCSASSLARNTRRKAGRASGTTDSLAASSLPALHMFSSPIPRTCSSSSPPAARPIGFSSPKSWGEYVP